MKNQKFYKRLIFAMKGIVSAWKTERSFRAEVLCGIAAVALLFFAEAELVWWGLFTIAIGAVLTTELLNTALEYFLDAFYPEITPEVETIKDIASGAVLMASLMSLGIFIAFILHLFQQNTRAL